MTPETLGWYYGHTYTWFEKKKKETLMTAFRLNLKKKQASKSSGAGEEDIFKPVWIFYDALESFLRNKYECKSIITTEDEVRK